MVIGSQTFGSTGKRYIPTLIIASMPFIAMAIVFMILEYYHRERNLV
ncbi:MAG: hypothetical protein GX329_07160 [Tissierellia bacterium]|nr:hypothetical protein [Tissierellia bacterium]